MEISKLKKNFESAVNDLTDAFIKQFEISKEDTWWVGNEIGRDLFCFGDMFSIDLSGIIYVLENNITLDEYLKYTDYTYECINLGFHTMNLRAWHTGCPRIPQETFERVKKLREEIQNLCDKTNAEF